MKNTHLPKHPVSALPQDKRSASKRLADLLIASFTKQSSISVAPGLTMGSPETCCGRCAFFRYPRQNQRQFDLGDQIIGQCTAFGEYVNTYQVCNEYQFGEPDVF